jgi:hypothetical protein
MLIKGIRSFSPENLNVIEFYRPLTIIVGQNGAGKTVRFAHWQTCMSYVEESLAWVEAWAAWRLNSLRSTTVAGGTLHPASPCAYAALLPTATHVGTLGGCCKPPTATALAHAHALQTIIECLKMACTGELPPNTRSGQSFIHDPKVSTQPPSARRCYRNELFALPQDPLRNETEYFLMPHPAPSLFWHPVAPHAVHLPAHAAGARPLHTSTSATAEAPGPGRCMALNLMPAPAPCQGT